MRVITVLDQQHLFTGFEGHALVIFLISRSEYPGNVTFGFSKKPRYFFDGASFIFVKPTAYIFFPGQEGQVNR